jgi:hypothetical protein
VWVGVGSAGVVFFASVAITFLLVLGLGKCLVLTPHPLRYASRGCDFGYKAGTGGNILVVNKLRSYLEIRPLTGIPNDLRHQPQPEHGRGYPTSAKSETILGLKV